MKRFSGTGSAGRRITGNLLLYLPDLKSEDIDENHFRTHTMELPYSCKVCGILKKTARELLNHNRREHLAEHKCKHCLEVYSTRADLMIHRKSHHQKLSRDYNCDVCGKDYHSSVAMNNHRNSAHTGVQYHCDTCQGIFKTK